MSVCLAKQSLVPKLVVYIYVTNALLQYLFISLYQSSYNLLYSQVSINRDTTSESVSMYRTDTTRSRTPRSTIIPRSGSRQMYNTLCILKFVSRIQLNSQVSIPDTTLFMLMYVSIQIQHFLYSHVSILDTTLVSSKYPYTTLFHAQVSKFVSLIQLELTLCFSTRELYTYNEATNHV